MAEEGSSEPENGDEPERAQRSASMLIGLLVALIVAAGFGIGFALAPGAAAEPDVSDGEGTALAGTDAIAQAEGWTKGLRHGLDAGAMAGYQSGAVKGEAKGKEAALTAMADAPVGTRSESQQEIGYRPSKDAVGELVVLPPGSLTPAKYIQLWSQVSAEDRAWAKRVSFCESGRNPTELALGGEYRGAFMFTMDAWHISPNSPGGDPIDYSWITQAVVAISLKHEMGTGPWPVCGTR